MAAHHEVLPREADWYDQNQGLEAGVSARLDTDCAYCHNPA